VCVEGGLTDDTGYPHPGAIESPGNRLDEGTGTILLRAIVPNPDQKLVAGLFARIRVPSTATKKTPLVPERAIGTDQSQKFVLVLGADDTVQYRAVKLGPAVDGQRIVREGVRAGEQIVVNGLQRVRPGAKVAPHREPDAKGATSGAPDAKAAPSGESGAKVSPEREPGAKVAPSSEPDAKGAPKRDNDSSEPKSPR
jgi:multidrug efflux system membrane fusion protein